MPSRLVPQSPDRAAAARRNAAQRVPGSTGANHPTRVYACPVEATQAVAGGKWKAVVIWNLFRAGEPLRFGALRRATPGVSEKVLAQQLRELERDGIVTRDVIATVPPQVQYALTEYGETLRAALDAACAWGEAHIARTGAVLDVPSFVAD